MTPEDTPAEGFDLVPTPDPSKYVVAYTAKMVGRANIAKILPISAWNTIGKTASTYAQFCLAFGFGLGSNVDQFGSQVFTYSEKAGPGLIRFFFSPNTPLGTAVIPYLKVPSFEEHPWPDVLKGLAIDQDSGLPVAQNIPDSAGGLGVTFGPMPYARVAHIPGGNFGTRKLRLYFWNATPMRIGQYPIPIPETISLDLPGNKRVEIPSSLHRRIEVEDKITASVQAIDGGANAVGSSIPGQIFPATNFEEWGAYTNEFPQQQSGAGWLGVRTINFPPSSPDTIIYEQ